MRILKRGGGNASPPLGNISLSVQKSVRRPELGGDTSAVSDLRSAGGDATGKPIYRNEALEILSNAARDALSAQEDSNRDSSR